MTTKTMKTILFASIIAAMILPFSVMGMADAAPNENANKIAHEKDKTNEIKDHEENLKVKVGLFKDHMEKFIALSEQVESAKQNNQSTQSLEKQIDDENKRWNVIAAQHKAENTIPESQLEKMIEQQSNFETKLLQNGLEKYITSVGINLHTKEIQVGLDITTVNADNKNQIIDSIDELMDKNAKWHVVDSERASLDSCTSEKYCVPLLGGNTITIPGIGTCSNGFKATKGGVYGFVTAGHCVDNKVGTTVSDYNSDSLGTVGSETMFWGTDCDCGFVTANTSETDKKTLLSTTSSVTVASYTSASSQSGDFIYKSGQTNTGLNYGTVTALNQTLFTGGLWITNLVASNASHASGDSGGTVMGNTDSLYGIISSHSGSNYYHVPTDKIISVLGIAVVM